MEPLQSSSPFSFQNGGGYTSYSKQYTNNQDNGTTYSTDLREQERPPLTPTSQNRYNQQQVAQKMVNSDYNQVRPSGSTPIRNQQYDFHIRTARGEHELVYDDVGKEDLIPPWETASSTNREKYVKRCAERSMLRRQGVGRPSVGVDENYMHCTEEEQYPSTLLHLPTPPQQQPQSPPTSTKSVSFNTRDKIHQWDDQLDELKHVDEVFFAAAKYLLEDVHNVANDYKYLEMEEEDFNLMQSVRGDVEGAVRGGTGGIGIFAKLFQCGDLNRTSSSTKPYLGIDGEILDDGQVQVAHPPRKKFKLTEKLLSDFQAALNYRLSKLDECDNETIEDRNDTAMQTREIARKIDAYGLPKLWRNECQEVADPNDELPRKESLVKPHQPENSPQRHADTHYFPLLPTENDDGEAEVEVAFKNPSETVIKSIKNESSSNLLSFFTSIFKSKTTPTEEQCEQNLQRIGCEIQKVHQMNNMTHNASVQSACRHRIAKLNYEKRFYQIIKEQYKIRQMQQTTRTGSVKFACQERLKQLMMELESLRVDEEDTLKDVAGQSWLDKAKQYVDSTYDDQPSLRNNAEGQYQPYKSTFHSDPRNIQYPQQSQQRQCHERYSSRFDERNHHASKDAPVHSPEYTHHRINYPASRDDLHNPNYPLPTQQQHPQRVQYNGKNTMQPKRGQRLPLAKPVPKNEGLNSFISYIAPS